MLDVGDQDGGGPAVVDAGGEGVEAEGHVDDEGSGDVAEAAGSGCRCGRRRRGWGGEEGGAGGAEGDLEEAAAEDDAPGWVS